MLSSSAVCFGFSAQLKSEATLVDLFFLAFNFHLLGSSALFWGIHIAIPSWRTNSFIIIECSSLSLIILLGVKSTLAEIR